MEFFSILDLAEIQHEDEESPAFFLDLNLYQIIDRICMEWGEDVKEFYYYLPADRASEDYRREVYADMKQNQVYDILCDFTDGMREMREASEKKEKVRKELQAVVWHIREVDRYCDSFTCLYKALENIPLKSRGMRNFLKYLQQYLATEGFVQMQARAKGLLGQLGNFKLTITYENDRITISRQEIPKRENAGQEVRGAYDEFLDNCFPGQDKRMKSPFDVSSDLSELEQEIFRVIQKQNPVFFQDVKDFYKKYREYADEALLRFAAEICFYLSFYCFEQSMKEEGFEFAEPEVEQTPHADTGMDISAEGLYDLALACTGRGEVVRNDMAYKTGENFFVLTGPNQGGKTTFARSLGQLVYFTKMGLDVPAHSAHLIYFTDILTHFSVEESVETGRGKLKEELIRLAPMMASSAHTQGSAFVVINELFTTAANYDACIMGKRVLEHFLAKGCHGIYVTHLMELSEAHPQIVSLRAMLDEEGTPSFKIKRGEASDSASAANQVNKYRLTYEQLKERLS